MKIDLRSMTRKELEKLRAEVDRDLNRATDRDRKAAIAATKTVAREHGFDLSHLANDPQPAKAKQTCAKKPSAPKYADPADKSQKWTGKGQEPQWFKDAISAVKQPGALAI